MTIDKCLKYHHMVNAGKRAHEQDCLWCSLWCYVNSCHCYIVISVTLARLNATCFDMALLFAYFWSQFLTDFHKWPFVLKLRTWSFRCTHCHDPTVVIMGPKRDRSSAKKCWHQLFVNVAKCILRPGWAVFPLLLAASNLVVHRPYSRWHNANNPFWTWI